MSDLFKSSHDQGHEHAALLLGCAVFIADYVGNICIMVIAESRDLQIKRTL